MLTYYDTSHTSAAPGASMAHWVLITQEIFTNMVSLSSDLAHAVFLTAPRWENLPLMSK